MNRILYVLFMYIYICLRHKANITLVEVTQGYKNAYTQCFTW